jgi:hypothetical protein
LHYYRNGLLTSPNVGRAEPASKLVGLTLLRK